MKAQETIRNSELCSKGISYARLPASLALQKPKIGPIPVSFGPILVGSNGLGPQLAITAPFAGAFEIGHFW